MNCEEDEEIKDSLKKKFNSKTLKLLETMCVCGHPAGDHYLMINKIQGKNRVFGDVECNKCDCRAFREEGTYRLFRWIMEESESSSAL